MMNLYSLLSLSLLILSFIHSSRMDSILPVVAVGISTISFLVASIIFVWIQSYNKTVEDAEAHVRRCGDVIADSRLHPLTTEKMAQQANYSHIANSLQVELHAVDTPNPLIPYTKISALNKVIVASKEKKGKDTKGTGTTPSAEALPVTAKTQEKTSEEKKDVFAKPENQRAKVAVNDPQYHTLANLDNADAFGNDKKSDKNTTASAPKKENKPVEKKKEKNPPEDEQKYQTLAAVEANDKKDQEEKAAAAAAATAAADAKKGFQAPQVVKKAESNDPQYQTLVNLENADAFGPQKPVFKTPTKVSKAEAKDPQYQTLAGLDDNLFKEEEKAVDGKKKEDKKEEKKDKEEKKKSEKDKKDEKNKEKDKKKSDKEKGKEISKEGSKEAKKESIDNIGDDIFKKKSQRSEIKSEMKDEKAAGSKKSKRSKSKKSKREGSKKSRRAT